ncbi:CPBP family intramembrane metalloprotease [Natrinema thermotolerans]|uniref:CPBP family intramembrane metalloprotease n=1 Tax=Natrinema thermotolerans TaxID=121872 RepID=A0AAF0PEZ8_9EURY|nr:CPBP family intramembrane glutamic endopeptidase [Natrinema thermotolerans]QCC58357.1 CPBP family intramembrane metalloprotease [Natrinema thermotolerans]WMT09476.1 CPBP family intramembrane metalloprotease [Natrinema thermotolerans]
MTETARADDAGPVASGAIPGIGTLLAGLTLVAMFVPVRNGVDDPSVWAGTGLAVAAVLAFLVRRHGSREPRLLAAVAAGSSVGVVLLAGYALNQGVTTSLLSIPIVFVAFVTAGLTVGVAVADFFGIGVVGLKRRTSQALVMTGVGLVGLILPQLLMILFAAPVYPFLETLPEIERLVATQLITQLGVVIGTAIVVVAFLRWTDRGLSFIDLRWPTLREVAWTVGGLIVLFGALFAISTLMQSTGVESADHSTTQRAADNPELMLIMVPIAILIIGPFEEVLYRNVIQKSLYETFSRFGAVAVASVIFAAVHVLAYATNGLGAVIASLGTIFGLSIVLGVIYERTENLLIPALVHGLYNALTFLNLYFIHA